MSPVIMDLPPAAIGHNSQACEVRPDISSTRIAAAKTSYLHMALQAGISERDRMLHYAAVTMDSAEFHAFFITLHHGTRSGDRVLIGQQRLADLMGCSDRRVRRIMTELDGKWFAVREKQRDARKGTIPAAVMQSLTAELIGKPRGAGQHIVVPAAMFPQHADKDSAMSRTPVSGSDTASRTGMSGSNGVSTRTLASYSESRVGHLRHNEPDRSVHITIEDKPYATALAHTSMHTHTREELDHLRRRLMEAGGSAINEAHGGFIVLAEPMRWLDGGCDLEMDIVPAVQKTVAAAGRRGAKIVSWSYFNEAVQEARDRRLLPMAKPEARTVSSQTNGSSWQNGNVRSASDRAALAIMREVQAKAQREGRA
jgi:hypothetical protein